MSPLALIVYVPAVESYDAIVGRVTGPTSVGPSNWPSGAADAVMARINPTRHETLARMSLTAAQDFMRD